MKKRVLSIILVVVMLLSLMPMAAFATDGDPQGADETLYWGYDAESKTLYLSKTDRDITSVSAQNFDATIQYTKDTM